MVQSYLIMGFPIQTCPDNFRRHCLSSIRQEDLAG